MTTLKYEQIADSLRQRIADGEFPPGAVLPSGRDLCEQWGVSRATAIKAYEILRSDGLLIAKQGRGFRVTETPLARPAGNRRSGRSRVVGGRPFRRMGTPTGKDLPPPEVQAAFHKPILLEPVLAADNELVASLRSVRLDKMPDRHAGKY